MQSERRGQIKHVYVRRRASTDVDARDALLAMDVDGRRRARCEWTLDWNAILTASHVDISPDRRENTPNIYAIVNNRSDNTAVTR